MNKILMMLLGLMVTTQAQRDMHWACGDSSLIRFSQSGPTVFEDTTNCWALNVASTCDIHGNLILYGDARYLYNKYGKPILDYDFGLPGSSGVNNYQSSILVPDQMNPNYVHFFYLGDSAGRTPLYYSLIDLTANNDSALVINGLDLIYTPTFGPDYQISPGLSATLDVNNQYWWVVAQELNTERFVKFKVGNGTIEGPFLQDVSIPHSSGSADWLALAAFSNSGTKYAIRHHDGTYSREYLMDFDRCTGLFSNLQLVDSSIADKGFGIPCFSPNDSLLYLRDAGGTTYWINQYNLVAPNIQTSKQVIITLPRKNASDAACTRLALDGRMYFGIPSSPTRDTGYYAVVHNPNVYGPGCNFEDKFLMMPGVFYGDIPNMPLYTTPPLTAQQAGCGYDSVTLTLGDSILLGSPDTSMGKCTFAWFPSTGLNDPVAAQPWCKPTTSGWYHLVVNDTTLSSPCAQTEDSVYVQVNAVGLEELLSGAGPGAWYPNPGTGTFHLRGGIPSGLSLTCTVYDLTGREVPSSTAAEGSAFSLTLDAPAGVYLVRLRSAGAERWDKVVVR